MAVNITKGQGVNLKKEAPNLKRALVGLGWDPDSNSIDIDASIICINKKGKKESVVYFGNKNFASGAIKHCGDNLTGEGDGDDEQIEVYLDKIPKEVVKLSVIINIYSAYSRGQTFSQVKNCFVHVMDMDNGNDLVMYKIDGDFAGKTGVFVADFVRENDHWEFKAVGEGAKVKNIDEMVSMKCKNFLGF